MERRAGALLALTLLPAVLAVLPVRYSALHCRREPTDTLEPQSPGNNNFGIEISNNPIKYVPMETYTVLLRGQKASHDQVFIGFMLVLERQDQVPGEVGLLQLTNRDLTKFSQECPHAITHSSYLNKHQVSVNWTAPPVGSGCVVFRATVIERRGVWRMDDGPLTKVICEEESHTSDELPDVVEVCTACDEAKYEITFEGLWSRYTHPKDFPPNEWLTHFSDLIGATHKTDYRIFEYGGLASEGLRQVAEMGSAKTLESELKGQSNKIRTIIKARGLWYPKVTGKTFAVFRTDRDHHLMSVVSMLGPSPDWFVGVSGLELCRPNGSWIEEISLPLFPLDAGTNSLNTYIGTRSPTVPPERIKRITSSNTRDSPFFDPSGAAMKPVARILVNRQRLYEKSCLEDANTALAITDYPNPIYPYSAEDDRPECQTTPWTEFSPCSVSCGEGQRMRSRTYINEPKALMMGCTNQLTEKKTCEFTCAGDVSCEMTPWSRWSECSATCGKGHRSRARKYLDSRAMKACKLELVEREMCSVGMEECPEPEEHLPAGCGVTGWSDWSPCTVTCGKGRRVRTRLYLSSSAASHCKLRLLQEGMCTADKEDCEIDPVEANVTCSLPKEPGPCRGYYPRWYFNSTTGHCTQFMFGGCRGNKNNFQIYNDCFKLCQMRFGRLRPPSTEGPYLPPGGSRGDTGRAPPIDCMVTPWSDWTQCSATCGKARMTRQRMIKQNPQNGGRMCPKKLVQRRRCTDIPPCAEGQHTKRGLPAAVDCALTPWGEWMPCTRTCGHAVQQRSREVQRHPRHGGAPCGPKWERKYCDLPPCSQDSS